MSKPKPKADPTDAEVLDILGRIEAHAEADAPELASVVGLYRHALKLGGKGVGNEILAVVMMAVLAYRAGKADRGR